MPEWSDDLLEGVDSPRPLSDAMRARLEHSLMTGDQPRPVAGAARDALERKLARRRVTRTPVLLGAAAVVAALAVTAALVSSGSSPTTSNALHHRSTSTSASVPGSPRSVSGSSGSAAAGGAGTTSGLPGPNAAAAAPFQAGPPVVSALSPSQGPTAGGAIVRLTGIGFVNVTAVHVAGEAAHYTVVSSTEIDVVMPAHSAGPAAITVTTAGGTSESTGASTYTYD